MSAGYGPIPPEEDERDDVPWYRRWSERRILYSVIVVLTVVLVTMGISLVQNATRHPTNWVDPNTCEYVLKSDRSRAILRCNIPEDYRVPNWPDKRSPLNGDRPVINVE